MNNSDSNVKLYSLCKKFIEDNEITCSETIYQTDRVAQNALEFIEQVCENVGFSYSDDDGDGASFTVDPDDLREALDALAPREGGTKC